MFGFSSLHVKPASGSLNKFQYNPVHVTTTDFGQFSVVNSRMLYPRDHYSVNLNTFSRTEVPLVRPTFGKMSVKTAAIVVPMKRVFMQSPGFFSNKQISDGSTSVARDFPWANMVLRFIDQDLDDSLRLTDVVTAGDAYDFFALPIEGTVAIYYRFTNIGRYFYKILRQLGYSLPSNMDLYDDANLQYLTDTRLSALPLLSFLTLYLDTFYPKTKVNQSTLSQFLYDVRVQESNIVKFRDLADYFLRDVNLYYGDSYLTTAWETNLSPLSGQQPLSFDSSLVNTNSYDLFDFKRNDNQGIVGQPSSETFPVSSRAIDFLSRVQRWFKRNMLSGSRPFEALKSQFGFSNPHDSFDYSQIIDVQSSPVSIGDITANASSEVGTEIQMLGDTAGIALIRQNGHFEYTCKEHCMFFIVQWISIDPFEWQGMKRDVFRIKPLDFYQPEFDGLDSQPILRAEVSTINHDILQQYSSSNNDTVVFGFTNRYDDLRFQSDMLTGDLSLHQFAPEITQPWHLGRRDLQDIVKYNYKAQSDKVLQVDGTSYDSIFIDNNPDADHFNVDHTMQITLMSTLQSFNEVAQLGVGDLKIERNGSQLS